MWITNVFALEGGKHKDALEKLGSDFLTHENICEITAKEKQSKHYQGRSRESRRAPTKRMRILKVTKNTLRVNGLLVSISNIKVFFSLSLDIERGQDGDEPFTSAGMLGNCFAFDFVPSKAFLFTAKRKFRFSSWTNRKLFKVIFRSFARSPHWNWISQLKVMINNLLQNCLLLRSDSWLLRWLNRCSFFKST